MLLASVIGKFLILVLLMRHLMHRGCDLPLCCLTYHQPCKMFPDQNGNVLPAPLRMTRTAGHLVLANWGQRAAKPPGITQSLADSFGMGYIQEWSAWGYLGKSVWNPWPELRSLVPASALGLGSASLGTNKGAQQAASLDFPENQKS